MSTGRSLVVVVLVVAAPPLVRLRLRIALWRVFPLLLAAERCQVEERPDTAERLDAARRREVGPKDLVALTNEDAEAETLAVLVRADARLRRRGPEVDAEVAPEPGEPRDRPPHPLAVRLDLFDLRPRHQSERRVARVQVREVADLVGEHRAAVAAGAAPRPARLARACALSPWRERHRAPPAIPRATRPAAASCGVLVVSARPAVEVAAASLRRPVEQLPGRIEGVGAAVVRRVRVVDDAVLERERAQAVELVAANVDLVGVLRRPEVEAAAGTALLVGEGAEVEVEVAVAVRDPGKAPLHPLLVRVQALERCAGDGDEGHVAVRQMGDGAGERVGRVRAARATRVRPALDRRSEHEVVDEQLRTAVEELGERLRPFLGLEHVLLVDRHARELGALPSQLVTPARELLLALEQLDPRRQPLLAGSDPGHASISIPGSVRPGTLAGATATESPSTTSPTATARVSAKPRGKTFSTKITAAMTAIQKRLITPTAKRTSIRPPEQPTQSNPCSSPLRKAPASSRRRRQRRRLRRLNGVSS